MDYYTTLLSLQKICLENILLDKLEVYPGGIKFMSKIEIKRKQNIL